MKRESRKLVLQRETLTALAPAALETVAGGNGNQPPKTEWLCPSKPSSLSLMPRNPG